MKHFEFGRMNPKLTVLFRGRDVVLVEERRKRFSETAEGSRRQR